MVDIGDSGRHSDGGVLSNSVFGQALEQNTLSLPPDRALPDKLPFVIVGDEAFPIKSNLMRRYPRRYLAEAQAIYNYWLSRARRVVENVFGILASRWRIFRRPIIATPESVVIYTRAAIALHNFLQKSELSTRRTMMSEGNEAIAQGLESIGRLGSNRHSALASSIRDAYKDYFSSVAGEVSWQYHHVHHTH